MVLEILGRRGFRMPKEIIDALDKAQWAREFFYCLKGRP